MPGGYNCDAGGHWMSDELVAEGQGRFYIKNAREREATMREWVAQLEGRMGLGTGHGMGHGMGHGQGYGMVPLVGIGNILSNARDVGFSKGLDTFDGPYYDETEALRDLGRRY